MKSLLLGQESSCAESNIKPKTEDTMKAAYREKIIEKVKHIECLDYLEFIYNMMMAFKEKWGI